MIFLKFWLTYLLSLLLKACDNNADSEIPMCLEGLDNGEFDLSMRKKVDAISLYKDEFLLLLMFEQELWETPIFDMLPWTTSVTWSILLGTFCFWIRGSRDPPGFSIASLLCWYTKYASCLTRQRHLSSGLTRHGNDLDYDNGHFLSVYDSIGLAALSCLISAGFLFFKVAHTWSEVFSSMAERDSGKIKWKIPGIWRPKERDALSQVGFITVWAGDYSGFCCPIILLQIDRHWTYVRWRTLGQTRWSTAPSQDCLDMIYDSCFHVWWNMREQS